MIIPVYRVLTTQYPIAATTTLAAGQPVTLNTTTGYSELSNDTDTVVGLAADRNTASEAYEWINRVSDSGNDTRASGMLSVYASGEFYVDVDDSNVTTPAGTAITGVVASGATTTILTLLYSDASGQMTHTDGGGSELGLVLEAAAALDSGIPGEFEPGSSVNEAVDGTPRTWIKMRLEIDHTT